MSSIVNHRWSLKTENEKNNTKRLTAEVSYMGLGSLEFGLIQKLTLDDWNYRNFHGSSLFEPFKFYCNL